ncbi:Hypothetical protein POVN_LOCUS718 [uncultured virus]|nr:Hypothetical protein POVN_LOCUS718 [uncultured virus]
MSDPYAELFNIDETLTTNDPLTLMTVLTVETKKYKDDPTPERQKQLEEWTEDVFIGKDVATWYKRMLFHRYEIETTRENNIPLPTTTRAERKLMQRVLAVKDQEYHDAGTDRHFGPFRGYTAWMQRLNTLAGHSSYDYDEHKLNFLDNDAYDLLFLQRKVIEPRYYEVTLPQQGQGKYLLLEAEDMPKVAGILTAPLEGDEEPGDERKYIDGFAMEVAYAVGIDVNLETSTIKASIRDPKLFAQAAQTPVYQSLISRLLHVTYVYNRILYQRLRETIVEYLNANPTFASTIADVYMDWFKE